MLQAAALAAASDESTTSARLERQDHPLQWTTEKLGPAVNVSGDGKTVSRQASGWSAQVSDTWFRGGRKPLVWTTALSLDEVQPDTMIGIVGRNYWSGAGDWSGSLAASPHAIVLRCSDGRIFIKGKESTFMLCPLPSGSRLNLIMDMQVQEMTVELLGNSPGVVLSSINIDGIPAELALAVGFSNGGAQSVRIVGCASEKPEMKLLGKLRKDLCTHTRRLELRVPSPLLGARGPASSPRASSLPVSLLSPCLPPLSPLRGSRVDVCRGRRQHPGTAPAQSEEGARCAPGASPRGGDR